MTLTKAKLERGRGAVATLLVQRGTLQVGDIFVAGGGWGRVRALIDDRGQPWTRPGPATPVEVLGLKGTPLAGDDFAVVENESRARQISEFRERRRRAQQTAAGARGTLEQLFSQIAAGESKELRGRRQDRRAGLAGSHRRLAGEDGDRRGRVRVLHAGGRRHQRIRRDAGQRLGRA